MRRSVIVHAVSSAMLARVLGSPRAVVAIGRDAHLAREPIAVGADIDGIVMRGRWRARVTLGDPSLTILGTEVGRGAMTLERDKTTLTVTSGEPAQLYAKLAHLRGLATSGAVRLSLDVRSNAPLFLDLAGTGTVEATGSVPLLRVTTSGSVSADLTALTATVARVHARQASHVAVRALTTLTIVALDSAHVSYRGTSRVQQTVRDAARVVRSAP